jgi:hypothetical protein
VVVSLIAVDSKPVASVARWARARLTPYGAKIRGGACALVLPVVRLPPVGPSRVHCGRTCGEKGIDGWRGPPVAGGGGSGHVVGMAPVDRDNRG